MNESIKKEGLCIYHGDCDDGFGAAYAVWKRYGNIDYHPGKYGEDPPDVTGRHVIIVDFSYKRDVLEAMGAKAKSITVIDHHKTAAEDLARWDAGLDNEEMRLSFDAFTELSSETGLPPIRVLFDMERSGAMMAWQCFHPGVTPPKLIEHIQDRDLWRFQLPGTREISAALRSYPQDFALWDQLDVEQLRIEGAIIERYYRKKLDELKGLVDRQEIGGVSVPILNAPWFMASDLAGELAEGEPFAAVWWEGPTGRTYSLRSKDGGMDVSEIAKQYGGGGHKNAAGFRERESQGPVYLLIGGGDGYMARTVPEEGLDDAFLEEHYGQADGLNAEEREHVLGPLHDDDNWEHAPGFGRVRYRATYEDGYVEVIRLTGAAR